MEASPTHRAREWTDVTMLLLTIEVLSPGSRRHDRETKRRFFQRVLIPEYWTVDLVRRVVERWRPNADVPEVLDTTLAWRPGTVAHALEIDLIALFATIER